MEESANPSNNPETAITNSDILQSLKKRQAQIGWFAKSVDSINSSRDEVIDYLLLHLFRIASPHIETTSHTSKFHLVLFHLC